MKETHWHNLSVKDKALAIEREYAEKFAPKLFRCCHCNFVVSERDRRKHLGLCPALAAMQIRFASGQQIHEHFYPVDIKGRPMPAIKRATKKDEPENKDTALAPVPMTIPAHLPTLAAQGKLPELYEAAQNALERCSKIDECKEWANRAEALASYAKQSKDNSLRQTADRIQARAVRRCGQLLKQIKPAKGGRPTNEKLGPAPTLVSNAPSRKEAAAKAGLSDRQRKQALRVARIPQEEFDQAVESQDPPTVTELEELGTEKKETRKNVHPVDVKNAAVFRGALRQIYKVLVTDGLDVASVVRGLDAEEWKVAYTQIDEIGVWMKELDRRAEKVFDDVDG